MARRNTFKIRQIIAVALAVLLGAAQASAGLLIRGGDGVVMTGADGIRYEGTSGVVMTGADNLLGFGPNGISWTGVAGVVMTGADGVVMTGADGVSYRIEHADSAGFDRVNGVVMTGADGVVMTGADGTRYEAASVTIREANGVVMTGADGVVMTGADGLRRVEENGVVMTGADGVVMTGADTVRLVGATEIKAVGPDGQTYTVQPDGVVMTGADGVVMTGADGGRFTNVTGLLAPGTDGVVFTGADSAFGPLGLQSFDPELASILDGATDDSNLNIAVVYHRPVTDSDLADLRQIGVTGGTRFRVLPVVIVTALPDQIAQITALPAVRSVYGNRTLHWAADASRQETGLTRLRADADVVNARGALNGSGVTVAVLDTGIDAGHPDLSGRVVRNVKLADLQGLPGLGFNYPLNVEGLRNTDLAYGHGTFVAGIVAGSGAHSGGRYSGYAPGAKLVGLSAGDANLFFVLAGFDYLLANREALGVRVVNCSFSASALFDFNDPVNIATKMLNDQGVNVIFSAGNTGPGPGSLNPYAAAPWVISVGATDQQGGLAKFSSRGDFGSTVFRPTVVAPGVNVVSARASGLNVTGLSGLTGADRSLSLTELLYYTTGSGTSFSAPQVAGTVALMLQANPSLTPAQVRSILRRTATPLPAYLNHEVGAGVLNAHAAALEAVFPARRLSEFRSTLDRGQVTFVKDAPVEFAGTAVPGQTSETALQMPDGVLQAEVQIGWGPLTSLNDLSLALNDAVGVRRGESNLINLPGLTGKRERTTVVKPEAGLWSVRVGHSLGLLATRQVYAGLLEVGRVQYAPIPDLGGYAGTGSLEDVRHALRTYVMVPDASGTFRPDDAATRSDLALALAQGARVPVYVAAQPLYADVTDAWARGYVESVQAAPGGALIPGATAGGAFNPSGALDRVTAAVALVRAAGLQSEAQAASTQTLGYQDAQQIPAQWRGHVHVAVQRGLISSDSTYFYPQQPLTRAQLAHAMSVIIARQIPPATRSLL